MIDPYFGELPNDGGSAMTASGPLPPMIDPYLMELSNNSPMTASQSSATDSHNIPDTPTPSVATTDTVPGTPSRVRITAKNPIYGRVEGAKRGNTIYGMLQLVPYVLLPGPIYL
jgi:hypothetical protein